MEVNRTKEFDVVVVGAGPGGAVASKIAAESGLKVLLLERGEKPGEKNVSGTALSPKCWRDLPFMKDLDLPNMRLASYQRRWQKSGIGQEFELGPEFAHFVKKIGFSMQPGEWLVPLVNEAAFSLFNVADAHIMNFRNAGDRLMPYLPPLVEAIQDVLLPITTAAKRSQEPRLPRPMAPLLEGMCRLFLRPVARLLGTTSWTAPPEFVPLLVKHFAMPFVNARSIRSKRTGRKK